jgi:hypothetical protein
MRITHAGSPTQVHATEALGTNMTVLGCGCCGVVSAGWQAGWQRVGCEPGARRTQ